MQTHQEIEATKRLKSQIVKLEVQLEVIKDADILGSFVLNMVEGIITREIVFLESLIKKLEGK